VFGATIIKIVFFLVCVSDCVVILPSYEPHYVCLFSMSVPLSLSLSLCLSLSRTGGSAAPNLKTNRCRKLKLVWTFTPAQARRAALAPTVNRQA